MSNQNFGPLLLAGKVKGYIHMKTYEIWSEGFHSSDGKGSAVFLGESQGIDFKDACVHFSKTNGDFASLFDPNRLTYWGCMLFDNEIDARKNFG